MEQFEVLYEQLLKRLKTAEQKSRGQMQLMDGRFQTLESKITETDQAFDRQKKELQQQLQRATSYRTMAARSTCQRKGGYAVSKPDFDKMLSLYAAVDENAVDDPAAAELWARADGAVKHIQHQLDQIPRMKVQAVDNARQEINVLREQILGTCDMDYMLIWGGKDLAQLVSELKDYANSFAVRSGISYSIPVPQDEAPTRGLGFVHRPLPLPEEQKKSAKVHLGFFYNEESESLRLPCSLPRDQGVKMRILHEESQKKQTQQLLNGFLFNVLRHYKPLTGRVLYLDPQAFNPEHLGVMKDFTGLDSMIRFPVNEREQEQALSALMATNGLESSHREHRILVVRNFPEGFSAGSQTMIRNICNNTAYNNISVVLTAVQNERGISSPEQDPMSDAITFVGRNEKFYLQQEGEALRFSWFDEPDTIDPACVSALQEAYKPVVMGSEYPARIPMNRLPALRKGNKDLRIPFGVDENDELTYLDMNGINFATYLMGASGSGKSTLLHAIITGLIRNYHPDDVELWLADFKMGEFAQYMKPRPPHVKYVLMDDSPELVFDFLNLLSQELTRRKQFFARHTEYKQIEDLPPEYRMPLIVVIIDEFSLMSQAIAQDSEYKLMLQNLLSAGRAPGFRFIFSSQDYTNGIPGLTEMAKSQIQSRIAMKNTTSEIMATLNTRAGDLTDQQHTWVDTLSPHVALSVSSVDGQTKFQRSQVLYFPKKKGRNAYDDQKDMIEKLQASMKKVGPREFDPEDVTTYVDKHPVDADGSTLKAYTPELFRTAEKAYRNKHEDEVFEGDLFLALGEPRRLDRSYVVPLAEENRENLMLFTGAERTCSLAVVLSCVKSFVEQGGTAQIWAYRRNQLYNLYRNKAENLCRVLTEPEEIGDAIEELRDKISRKQSTRELVVLMGMDHIVEDFELMEPSTGWDENSFAVDEDLEEQIQKLQETVGEELDRIQMDGIDQGKSQEEIDREVEAFLASQEGMEGMSMNEAPGEAPGREAVSPSDYRPHLQYIVSQGPHCGCHFLLCASSAPEVRKMGLNTDLFRQKLCFRLSKDDSVELLGSYQAAMLPDHICSYTGDQKQFTFRPFLHPGLSWDGWDVDENGEVQKTESEDYFNV